MEVLGKTNFESVKRHDRNANRVHRLRSDMRNVFEEDKEIRRRKKEKRRRKRKRKKEKKKGADKEEEIKSKNK